VRLRAEIAALERIVCARDDELDACKAERDELRADVEDLVQYASNVERERDELLADVDELAQYARDVTRERDEMCQDAKELAQYACDLSRECDVHGARADKSEAKFAQLCGAADEAFQHADDAVVRCHELESEVRSLEGEVAALQDQLVQKEDVIVRIRSVQPLSMRAQDSDEAMQPWREPFQAPTRRRSHHHRRPARVR
jgi:uncharacterized coiled-coil DUF342 family protein